MFSFPAPFVEEAVFTLLYILASVKNKVPIRAWVYFWAFYLVPLVYISVFVPVSYYLDDCSYEIKRRLLLGRKAMTNLDNILKSRGITLPTKVPLVKTMAFPVVMDGCENWTIRKAEHQRIDAFELWCWRRLLRVP